MHILIVGLNHHAAPVALREMIAPPSKQRAALCQALVDETANEAVLISTCNRTEVVLTADNPDAGETEARALLASRAGEQKNEIEKALFSLRGLDAVRHLFEVATSLDSLVIGEPHIIGQIREDLDRAVKAGTVGKMLGRLFSHAISLAKAVRRQTALGCAPVSVSSIALDLTAKVFGAVFDKNLLVLGTGEMGRQTAILAAHRGARITACSRTLHRAEEIARKAGGACIPWEDRRRAMVDADIIVTATGATSPVIGREDMARVMHERKNRRIFIIDIAVPRDVDKAVDDLYNLYRYDLDDLIHAAKENAARRKDEIPKVRGMIDTAVDTFDKWQKERRAVPNIVMLREKIEQIRKTELDACLGKIQFLDDRDKNIIDAMSSAIVRKMLHMPTVRLKEAAVEGTDRRHAGSLRYLFGLDPEDRNLDDDNDE